MTMSIACSLTGCTVEPRMRLASNSRELADGARWWVVQFDGGNRDPIVGVEFLKDGQPHQLLMSDRGARLYRYRRSHLSDWGPPLPAEPSDQDLRDVRLGLRRVLSHSASKQDGDSLNAEIRQVRDMRDVVTLMDKHWADRRVEGPAMSPAELDTQLTFFPLGLDNLLKAAL